MVNRWVVAALFCVGLVPGLLSGQGPLVMECSTDTPLNVEDPIFGNPVVSTISVAASAILNDTQVLMDINHSFVGDLVMTLTAPSGAMVTLHDLGGNDTDNIDVTYTDTGIANGAPYDCFCDMQPSGPGAMADFSGVVSAGDWNLEVLDVFPACGGGCLESWCLSTFGDFPNSFVRGDFNGDGQLMPLVDTLALLSFQFLGGAPPPCLEAADVNGEGTFNAVEDAVHLLAYAFLMGDPPPAPFPTCGADPNLESSLGCNAGCP